MCHVLLSVKRCKALATIQTVCAGSTDEFLATDTRLANNTIPPHVFTDTYGKKFKTWQALPLQWYCTSICALHQPPTVSASATTAIGPLRNTQQAVHNRIVLAGSHPCSRNSVQLNPQQQPQTYAVPGCKSANMSSRRPSSGFGSHVGVQGMALGSSSPARTFSTVSFRAWRLSSLA